MGSVELLNREVYSSGEAARLLGVPTSTLRRWLNGHERAGQFYPPVLRSEPGSDIVTWGEFVEAGYLREYRRLKVSLQSLRPFILALRESLDVPYPLAHARPWVHDRHLVQEIQEASGLDERLAFVEYNSGQLVLSPVAEAFFKKVEFDSTNSVARRMYPEGRDSHVVIDPRLAWGEPTVDGIRTDNIYELWQAGDDPDRIAEAFDLTREQVQAALRYEAGHGKSQAA
jgi:uncharacterized protein (DUF433 family)